MISPNQVEKARRLLAAGTFSRNRIARLTGVSRATVRRIALEKRRSPPQAPPEDDLVEPAPPTRCSGCGGLVHGPCRLCQVRARIEKTIARRRDDRRADARAALVAVMKAQRSRVSA